MNDNAYPLAVVGAGPAGVAAAVEAGRLGFAPVLLLDRSGAAGGSIAHAHAARNVPFLPQDIPGEVVAAHLRALCERSGCEVTHAEVARISWDSGAGVVESRDGRAWKASRVVVAVGARPIHPRVAGLGQEFTEPWADSAAAALERGGVRTAAVIGAGDVAFDQARRLCAAGVQATVLCRAPEPRAPAWLVRAALEERVVLSVNTSVLNGERSGRGAVLCAVCSGREALMEFDCLVAAVGREPVSVAGMQPGKACRWAGDVRGRAGRHVVAAMGDGCVAAAELLDGREKEP